MTTTDLIIRKLKWIRARAPHALLILAFVMVVIGALVLSVGNIVLSKIILFVVMGLFVMIAVLALFTRIQRLPG